MRLFSNKFVAAGFQQIVCAIGKLLFVCFVGLFLAVESIECIHFEKKRRGKIHLFISAKTMEEMPIPKSRHSAIN